MWWWKDAFLRLRTLFFRREMDEELQAELQSLIAPLLLTLYTWISIIPIESR